VADCIEGFALSSAEKGRPTNAARYMQRFAARPYSTWRNIELSLAPSKARLGAKSKKYDDAIIEIMDFFNADEFIRDEPLEGEFLLGYHTQRSELMKSSKLTETHSDNAQNVEENSKR
jgi:CRISPR-associated protein Csd1